MIDQGVADTSSCAGDHIDYTRRNSSLAGQRCHLQRRARCKLRGLDDAAAGGKCERQLLEQRSQRDVPGDDHADDAPRGMGHEAEIRNTRMRNSLHRGLSGKGGGITAKFCCPVDLGSSVADWFPGFFRLDDSQPFRLGRNLVEPPGNQSRCEENVPVLGRLVRSCGEYWRSRLEWPHARASDVR